MISSTSLGAFSTGPTQAARAPARPGPATVPTAAAAAPARASGTAPGAASRAAAGGTSAAPATPGRRGSLLDITA